MDMGLFDGLKEAFNPNADGQAIDEDREVRTIAISGSGVVRVCGRLGGESGSAGVMLHAGRRQPEARGRGEAERHTNRIAQMRLAG